jgi:outer membrane cobalamin receptor
VLQNGRRIVAGIGGTSAVDVNNIPVDLLERVELITGGASAVYGSEAVSGVVNFILKNDFEGIRVRAQGGCYGRGRQSASVGWRHSRHELHGRPGQHYAVRAI